MLKGHTRIELRNVKTGEVEVHEDCNLITKAIDNIINMEIAMNGTPNDNLLPIASKLLGGIMLFDGELEEDVNNIHFPVNAHLVGYANQNVDTESAYRGSYNSMESGRTDTGFTSVWDFGTSQANGVIKAIARTSNRSGANPLRYMVGPRSDYKNIGVPSTDSNWSPIRYDGENLYVLKGDSSTHIMRLARVKLPFFRMGVADYSGAEGTYEVIASWDTQIYFYNNKYIYADDHTWYRDGRDGYIYAIVGDGYNESGKKINYFTIKYSDDSYDKSDYITLDIDVTYSNTVSQNCRTFRRNMWNINNKVLYLLSSDSKAVYIININNVAAKKVVRVIADDSRDLINMNYIAPYGGGVYVTQTHYTGTGTTAADYFNGIVYPDGTYTLPEIKGSINQDNWTQLTYSGDNLEIFGNSNAYNPLAVIRCWEANYLGTINNLPTAITKTSAQTMKIVYTLTDIDG